ncbi:hypothetical protein ACSL103130_06915 [Actinomyces slackii]|uniref:Uncharacterized protein n=1 Tax=Actinomyces slackii TaxID=52774 RepID=A0A3S4ULM0_9ACTO|nr:hypothetical protein [Actinomyces slackii]VEG73447.1 Uncharacterised protein [Actinomyces slackii]
MTFDHSAPQPPDGAQQAAHSDSQSPWKARRWRFFWPTVAAAVLVWTVALVICFATIHASGQRGLTRFILVGLGAGLVYAVRTLNQTQVAKEIEQERKAAGYGSGYGQVPGQAGTQPPAGYGQVPGQTGAQPPAGYGQVPGQTGAQPPAGYGQVPGQPPTGS